MMDKLKKLFKKETKAEGDLSHRDLMMKEKEAATKENKPWVGVLDTQVNKDNIRNGFFELDWNNEFIEQLLDAGYAGESNEEIVDKWFKDLARNVLAEEGHDPNRGAGFINTKNIGDGKSEVK